MRSRKASAIRTSQKRALRTTLVRGGGGGLDLSLGLGFGGVRGGGGGGSGGGDGSHKISIVLNY